MLELNVRKLKLLTAITYANKIEKDVYFFYFTRKKRVCYFIDFKAEPLIPFRFLHFFFALCSFSIFCVCFSVGAIEFHYFALRVLF